MLAIQILERKICLYLYKTRWFTQKNNLSDYKDKVLELTRKFSKAIGYTLTVQKIKSKNKIKTHA